MILKLLSEITSKNLKVLGIFTHPDDESAWAGATISKYVRLGYQVILYNTHTGATSNNVRLLKKLILQGEHPRNVRRSELKLAAKTLGAHHSRLVKPDVNSISKLISKENPDIILTQSYRPIPGSHKEHLQTGNAVKGAIEKLGYSGKVIYFGAGEPKHKISHGDLKNKINSFQQHKSQQHSGKVRFEPYERYTIIDTVNKTLKKNDVTSGGINTLGAMFNIPIDSINVVRRGH